MTMVSNKDQSGRLLNASRKKYSLGQISRCQILLCWLNQGTNDEWNKWNTYKILGVKEITCEYMRRWEDNIKTDNKQIEYENVNWICLRKSWLFWMLERSFGFHKRWVIFLTERLTTSFSSRIYSIELK
jgi:hypothetical protein